MSSDTFGLITAALAFIGLVAFCLYVYRDLEKFERDRSKIVDESKKTKDTPAPDFTDKDDEHDYFKNWTALPGGVIELGVTGYQIRKYVRDGNLVYELSNPEGKPLGRAAEYQLINLMDFAQTCAASRAMFDRVPKTTWRPK